MRIFDRGRAFNCFLIDASTACQLKCVMCPRTAFVDKLGRRNDMPIETYKRIARYFPHTKFVYFTGWEGECLLHKDIFEMIRMAKEAACLVGIVTNGMALTKENSERLMELGLDFITVSMAGAVRETHEGIRSRSDFYRICENVRTMTALKTDFKTTKPEVNLSFLMTRKNIAELPLFIKLAKDLDANKVTAPNLSYVATPLHDDIKAFSCRAIDESFLEKIREAERTAGKYKIAFRAYPLAMEDVFTCEENPLANIYISSDGYVSPCVYLNFPMENIARIFCGKSYAVKRTHFGNIAEEDLFDIWNKEEYKEFRQKHARRAALGNISLDFGDVQKLRERIKKLGEAPLPEVCKTCYKAYGI